MKKQVCIISADIPFERIDLQRPQQMKFGPVKSGHVVQDRACGEMCRGLIGIEGQRPFGAGERQVKKRTIRQEPEFTQQRDRLPRMSQGKFRVAFNSLGEKRLGRLLLPGVAQVPAPKEIIIGGPALGRLPLGGRRAFRDYPSAQGGHNARHHLVLHRKDIG